MRTMKPSSKSANDDEPIHTCLELVAKKCSSKGGGTMTGTPPKIVPESNKIDDKYAVVHWSDAYKMDIHNGEPALIVRRRVEEGIPNYISVVCNIRVSAPAASNGRKTASNNHPVPKQKRGQEVSSKIGEILLSPNTLYESLAGSTRPKSEDSNNIQTDVHQSDTVAENITYISPSKSTFSFSKGGGGKSLITPSRPSSSGSKFSFAKGGDGNGTSPTSSHLRSPPLNTQYTKHALWNVLVVPLINLPPQHMHRLCPDAQKIYIRPTNKGSNATTSTTIDSYFTSSSKIIQQLIIAKYQGTFIQSQGGVDDAIGSMEQYETISISFRGQIEYFRIVKVLSVLPRDEDESYLLSSFGRLNLSEEGGSEVSESEDQLQTFLQSHISDRRKKNDDDTSKAADIACRVTHRTLIEFAMHPTTAVVGTSQNDTSRKPSESTKFCAGLDTTLARIKDALLPPLLHPNIFPSGGPLRPPKGALLYGPAGVGKSLMAAQIAYDLGHASSLDSPHAKVHVRQIQCANILSSTAIVGEAERLLTNIFDEAEKCKDMGYMGTLIILDDVHLICPRRGGGSGVDQIASTLLALLDGIGSSSSQTRKGKSSDRNRLVVLAITTDPSLLDPALRRPGRLDVEIEVVVPDDKARADILRFHLSQIMPSQQVDETDFNALARLAKGFTGADCKLAVKEAVRISISRAPRPGDITRDSTGLTLSTSYEIKFNDLVDAIRITKPSAIKLVAVEVPKVPWSAIGGMDDVKALLKESIELPLTHPHLFEMMRVPPPKGILLYGPPGCSKTLMARAIATEGNMNFLAVKGPELLSKWLGESERALASLFRRARLAAPSVIFFDELDSIASKRGEGGGGSDRLLSQLLTELDGVTSGGGSSGGKSPPRVVVVGATNRPDVLDPALTRPGRMDRMIYVGLPDKQGRYGIFKIGLTGKDCHENVDLDVLASDDISKGYTGAEIIALCRDAALHAIGEMDDGIITKPQIHMKHLLMSIKDMKPRTTPEMLRFYESFRGRH